MVEPALVRLLARIPGVDPARARVSPLKGGITNRNYRVDGPAGSYVLRVAGRGSAALGIDRRRECRATRVAAAAGIGPEVVVFLPEVPALVTRFIHGRGLTRRSAARPAVLRRIVASIRRYHSGRPFPGRFCPFETVRRYGALARRRGVRLPAEAGRALEALARVERATTASRTRVPCHNDLLPGNLIDDGRRIRVLDWEYAGMGDPFFDLGNLAANLSLSAAAERRLLALYLGRRPRAGESARLASFRLASDMREAFWGFLQAGVSTLPFDFMGYGRKHVRKFLRCWESGHG